jgi:hypothetical protein
MAFGTNADQLHGVLKAAELAHTKIKKVADNTAFTFNRKGELTSHFQISPVKRTWQAADNKAYYASMGWDYEDRDTYSDRFTTFNFNRNVVPLHSSEAPVIPADVQRLRDIEDGIIPDGAPNLSGAYAPEFLDDRGEPLPRYIIDKMYKIIDSEGNEIDYETFCQLDDTEQSFCEIVDMKTGDLISRYAG